MNIVPSDREPVRKGKRSCGALRGSLAEHFLGQGHDLKIFIIFPVFQESARYSAPDLLILVNFEYSNYDSLILY